MTTIITRDTENSFFKIITNEKGAEFSRKLEKGTPEYSNACFDFHIKNVKIIIGNSITK